MNKNVFRILALVLALTLALTASACGSRKTASQKLEEKLVEKALEKQGMDVDYDRDGTMTVKTEEGTAVIREDGSSVVYTDENGAVTTYGSTQWPDNEFTRLVPKPDFPVYAFSQDSSGCVVVFGDGTEENSVKLEDIRAYAEKLKSAGFDQDPQVSEAEYEGMSIYSFAASDASGCSVQLGFSAGSASLQIRK